MYYTKLLRYYRSVKKEHHYQLNMMILILAIAFDHRIIGPEYQEIPRNFITNEM